MRRFKDDEELNDWLLDNGHDGVILIPDFAPAVIGISSNDTLVYSYDKMVRCLANLDSIPEDQAMEYIDYNTIRSLPYWGDRQPVIMYDID